MPEKMINDSFTSTKSERDKKRKRYNSIKSSLENERSTFRSHWQDIANFVRPRRAKFLTSDVNKGDKRHHNIVNEIATIASRTLRSGMMSGVTSPSRVWFRLTTEDPDLADNTETKMWLYNTTQRLSNVLLKSNFYSEVPKLYGDLGDFGTGAIIVEEDYNRVIRFQSLPIYSYCISNQESLRVDTLTRDFMMSVRQIVEKWGYNKATGEIDWTNISDHVKERYEGEGCEDWINVSHIIVPNYEWNPRKLESRFKRYISTYYESGGAMKSGDSEVLSYNIDTDKFLSEKGYDYFPALVPRWETSGEDVYGTSCPGMDVLGTIKGVQTLRKKIMKAIGKTIDPPMLADSSLRNQRTTIIEGEINYVDTNKLKDGMKPVYQFSFDINHASMMEDKECKRIERMYYSDLFLMMIEDERRQPATATEIQERHEEKLLALGPVMENLNQDFLDPMVAITLNFMARQGLLAPAPEIMRRSGLKIEYQSVMAQAQKLMGIAGIERSTGWIGQVAQYAPDALDKIDVDEMIDRYADAVSLPPSIIRSDDKVAAIRTNRQKQIEQQKQMEQAQVMAKSAKDLAGADTSGDNALTRMMQDANAGNLVPAR